MSSNFIVKAVLIVCMCVFVYMCLYMYVYVCISVCVYMCVLVCVCVCASPGAPVLFSCHP